MRIKISDEEINVEVADNFFKRAKGLSFRTEGVMLFKFPRKTTISIDMMLVSKPLYLYFMDSEKRVIDVQKAEPWTFDPRTWKLYSPSKPYRYLLESFEELDIDEGDVVN